MDRSRAFERLLMLCSEAAIVRQGPRSRPRRNHRGNEAAHATSTGTDPRITVGIRRLRSRSELIYERSVENAVATSLSGLEQKRVFLAPPTSVSIPLPPSNLSLPEVPLRHRHRRREGWLRGPRRCRAPRRYPSRCRH